MPAFPEGEKHYDCITQDGMMYTLGKAETAKVAQHDGFDHIVVGDGSIIPRWSGTAANPTKLLYEDIRSHWRCHKNKLMS